MSHADYLKHRHRALSLTEDGDTASAMVHALLALAATQDRTGRRAGEAFQHITHDVQSNGMDWAEAVKETGLGGTEFPNENGTLVEPETHGPDQLHTPEYLNDYAPEGSIVVSQPDGVMWRKQVNGGHWVSNNGHLEPLPPSPYGYRVIQWGQSRD